MTYTITKLFSYLATTVILLVLVEVLIPGSLCKLGHEVQEVKERKTFIVTSKGDTLYYDKHTKTYGKDR